MNEPVWKTCLNFYWRVWLLQGCGYWTGVAIAAQWGLTNT